MKPTIANLAEAPGDWLDHFRREGYVGPVRMIDPKEGWSLLNHVRASKKKHTDAWEKNLATVDHMLHWHATRPHIIETMRHILGDDINLTRANFITRPPGEDHPWHSDSELDNRDGDSVIVWLGLDNTCEASAFQFISRSHLAGKSIQQLRHERAVPRDESSTDEVLGWAREHVADPEHVWPDITDGEALIVDGRLWHKTENNRQFGRLSAVIFHYAASHMKLRKRDYKNFDWPLKWLENEKAPVIAVSGTPQSEINEIVPPPHGTKPSERLSRVGMSLDQPLGDDPVNKWKPRHLFNGATSLIRQLNCHVSVLSPGHCPHPPHIHDRDEVLMVLDGKAEVVIAERPDDPQPRVESLTPGAVSFYPAGQHHTIRNDSTEPVTYLMLDWNNALTGSHSPLKTLIARPPATTVTKPENDFHTDFLFEGETAHVKKLHCHLTTLQPDAGYAAHRDPYDIAIVLLSGMIEVSEHVMEPQGVVFMAAGEPHGMWNIGTEPARYLVFEWHGTLGKRVINSLTNLGNRLRSRS